jgi:hypothetical protein
MVGLPLAPKGERKESSPGELDVDIDRNQCCPGERLYRVPSRSILASLDRPAAVPLDRKTLLARFDGIRQFVQSSTGGTQ